MITKNNPEKFINDVLGHKSRSSNHAEWHRLLDSNDNCVIRGHLESGLTDQISIGRVLYELGKNPNLRIACIVEADYNAKTLCAMATKYALQSKELREVYPHFEVIDHTVRSFTMERAKQIRDPSFQTCGMHGNILGARIDLLLLDGVLDNDAAFGEASRKADLEWLQRAVACRLVEGSRVWCYGSTSSVKDAMESVTGNSHYAFVKSPVLDEKGNPTWPEQWPMERIERMRRELGTHFEELMMCKD